MCNRYFSTADAAIDREDLTAPSIKGTPKSPRSSFLQGLSLVIM